MGSVGARKGNASAGNFTMLSVPSVTGFKKATYDNYEKFVDTVVTDRDYETGRPVEGQITASDQVISKLQENFGKLRFKDMGSVKSELPGRSVGYFAAKDKTGNVVAIQRREVSSWHFDSDAILTDYGRELLSKKKNK